MCGADSSELLGLCFLWQNAMSCAFPVTYLAALLVVQTCSAEEGEEWVLPTRRMSCWMGRGGDPLCQTTYRGKKKILQPFSPIFLSSSLRKNPAERMNYLELMVSVKPFLLVFIAMCFQKSNKWSRRP